MSRDVVALFRHASKGALPGTVSMSQRHDRVFIGVTSNTRKTITPHALYLPPSSMKRSQSAWRERTTIEKQLSASLSRMKLPGARSSRAMPQWSADVTSKRERKFVMVFAHLK